MLKYCKILNYLKLMQVYLKNEISLKGAFP